MVGESAAVLEVRSGGVRERVSRVRATTPTTPATSDGTALQTPPEEKPLRSSAAPAPTRPRAPMATDAGPGRCRASRPIPAAATSSTTAIPLMRTGLSQVPSNRTAVSLTGVGAASTATEPTAISGEAAGLAISAATR